LNFVDDYQRPRPTPKIFWILNPSPLSKINNTGGSATTPTNQDEKDPQGIHSLTPNMELSGGLLINLIFIAFVQ